MDPLVQHFDHFVVPADDLVAVEEFYLAVFACRLAVDANGRPMRFGLTLRQRAGGMPPHTFFEIASKRRAVLGSATYSGTKPIVLKGVLRERAGRC